jgi:hypothetical protein
VSLGRLEEFISGYSEPLQELSLDVSTEELLSAPLDPADIHFEAYR